MNELNSIPIVVSQCLAGSKKAIRVGNGPIHLSPAMYDLISHAEGDELERLLRGIPLLTLPEPFDWNQPIMFTEAEKF